MSHPWLEVDLDDYEAHMAHPAVGQAALLSDLLGTAVRVHRPRSVAVLGCAGGNGFERLVAPPVERVVGIDLNPAFLARARERFATRLPRLELHALDVESDALEVDPVDLVFAGLLFEYVEPACLLPRLRPLLTPSGHLVVVLQLPGAVADVSPSPHAARLAGLGRRLCLVPPAHFERLARECGYAPAPGRVVETASGKAFHVQAFGLAEVPEPGAGPARPNAREDPT